MRVGFAIAEDVVWTDLGDEAVLLKLDRGIYFGLDQIGARIWALMADGRSREEIPDIVATEYEVSFERVDHDLEELIGELSREGLIKAGA